MTQEEKIPKTEKRSTKPGSVDAEVWKEKRI